MKVLGVDPGSVHAALASWDGTELVVEPVPAVKSKGRGSELDLIALAEMVEYQFGGFDHAFIEQVQAMPGEGAGTGFKFGYGCGAIRGIIAAQLRPVTMVTPAVWKPPMGLNRDKDYSRARAIELWPSHHADFKFKKDADKAEASLIAYYGWMKLMGRLGEVRNQVQG